MTSSLDADSAGPPTSRADPPFFYGLEPHALTRDRLYRLYASEEMLAGAYIAGQIYDELSARVQLQQLLFLLQPAVRRWLRQRDERERAYDQLAPASAEFLQTDVRNFRLQRTDVLSVRFRRNRSLRTPANVGSFRMELFDGSRRRFILVGDQDQEFVLRQLKRFHPELEVTGESTPVPKLRPPTVRQRRTALSVCAVAFLAAGGVFVAAALKGNPTPILWPLALMNFAAAGWLVFRAAKLEDSSGQGEPGPRKFPQ